MKIAVLSECFLSESNIAYLKSLGDLEIYLDTSDAGKAIARMAGKDIVLADMYETPLNAEVLRKSPHVKLLCINSTGFDLVALDTASSMNIQVANTPGFSTEAVAEHTFALLLAVNRHIAEAFTSVKAGSFQINPADKTHYKYLGVNLAGKTIGIIGLGAIGTHVAKIASGFGMHIIGYNRSNKNIPNIESVSLDTLFERSDVISLHTPLNDQSKGIVNASNIVKMKKSPIIVNTARGKCILSKDLAAALDAGKLAGAGLDDLDDWTLDNPLLSSPNTVITPHSAWFTKQALDNIGEIMTANVKAFIEGKPQSVINVRNGK